MHKAGKVNSHGGCGGGIFGKKLMIIETTTIGGGHKPPTPLSESTNQHPHTEENRTHER